MVTPRRRSSLIAVVTAVFLTLLMNSSTLTKQLEDSSGKLDYPKARRANQVDVYHGVEVSDPYRWLEDMTSLEAKQWIDRQEKLFDDYVENVAVRQAIKQRIQEISHVDVYGAPFKRGQRYFFTKTEAGKNQSVVHVQENLEAEPQVLLDPFSLFEDQELRFAGFTASPDGKRIAYRVARGQTVWSSVHVMDVDTKKVWPEKLDGVSSISWTEDSRGLFYVRYEVPEDEDKMHAALSNPRIFFHRVGDQQSEDRFVFALEEHPQWLLGTRITHDGRYLIINISKGSSFSGLSDYVYYKDLQHPESQIVKLIQDDEAKFSFEGSNGSTFYLRTTLDAPRNRLIAVDIDRPQRENWQELIPQAEEALATVSEIGDRLVLRYNRDALPVAKVFDFDGEFKYEVDFPSIALVAGFPDDRESSEAFYQFWGLLEQGATYRMDLATGKSRLFRRPTIAFRPQDFILKQIFYTSKDGTRVPMFIAHRRDLQPDKNTPAFMYAYGALAWSAMPWYQPHILAWMEMGGIYAFPNIRGGGEYGDDWYQDGILHKKQNGIDDYISAAEWLIENNYTSASRMIADGQSASGLLAGAAIVQRPDLFGASLIDHPRLDMLRYHLFTGATARMRELGSSEEPEQFNTLVAYSPYHNLKAGTCYPAALVVVGEQDEVTPPLHGYKFTAALQAAQSCEHPALLKVVRSAGHVTYGTTPEARAETWADIWSFLAKALDMQVSTDFGTRGSD